MLYLDHQREKQVLEDAKSCYDAALLIDEQSRGADDWSEELYQPETRELD